LGSKNGVESLKKKAYNLGFKVGYYHHFEHGWVIRELNKLKREGQKENIDIYEYYLKGKKDGEERRKRDLSRGDEVGKVLEEELSIGYESIELIGMPRMFKIENMFPRIIKMPEILFGFLSKRLR